MLDKLGRYQADKGLEGRQAQASATASTTERGVVGQVLGAQTYRFAKYLRLGSRGAEVTTGLRKLLESKDCLVRSFLPRKHNP